MYIILEGNECCFKSTVIEAIKQQFPDMDFQSMQGSHFTSANKGNEALFKYHKEKLSHGIGKNLILDRSYVSNMVYATAYDDYSILSPKQISYIESILMHEGVILIYMYDTPDNIFDRLSVRGDEYIKTKDELVRINNLYEWAFKLTEIEPIRVDCADNDSIEKLLRAIDLLTCWSKKEYTFGDIKDLVEQRIKTKLGMTQGDEVGVVRMSSQLENEFIVMKKESVDLYLSEKEKESLRKILEKIKSKESSEPEYMVVSSDEPCAEKVKELISANKSGIHLIKSKDGHFLIALEDFETNKLMDLPDGVDLDINLGNCFELLGGNKLLLSSEMMITVTIVREKFIT